MEASVWQNQERIGASSTAARWRPASVASSGDGRAEWTKPSGAAVGSRDDVRPDTGYEWAPQSKWSVDLSSVSVSRDSEGYEYAPTWGDLDLVGSARPDRGWATAVRRRRWVRSCQPRGAGSSAGPTGGARHRSGSGEGGSGWGSSSSSRDGGHGGRGGRHIREAAAMSEGDLSRAIARLSASFATARGLVAAIGGSRDRLDSRRALHKAMAALKEMRDDANRRVAYTQRSVSHSGAFTKLAKDLATLTKNVDALTRQYKSAVEKHPMRDEYAAAGARSKAGGSYSGGGGGYDDADDSYSGGHGSGDGRGAADARPRDSRTLQAMAALEGARVEDQAAVNARIIDERAEEVGALARDAHNVKQIYDDLGFLVAKDGDAIETILDNSESAAEDARRGVEDLKKAKEEQERCVVM